MFAAAERGEKVLVARCYSEEFVEDPELEEEAIRSSPRTVSLFHENSCPSQSQAARHCGHRECVGESEHFVAGSLPLVVLAKRPSSHEMLTKLIWKKLSLRRRERWLRKA